jgi:rRNA maturation protein Nop10
METAGGRQNRSYEPAITAHDEPQQVGDHVARRRSSSRNSLTVRREARTPYGGRTRSSKPARFSCSRRKASRMHRLMRLRSTAAAACLREIRIPSRGVSPAARLTKNV